MNSHHYSLPKLLTVYLSLLCLLSLSWSAATASAPVPLLPQPSSALLAADTLRSRGYSIFASLIVSITSTYNFSGTLLAPPDFAFSFASAKFRNNHRPAPRPSIPLLLYHTLRPPLVLTWPSLSTRDDGDELRTFFNYNCLYLLKTSYGEVSISSSPFKNPIAAVTIRQPDLYVDEHLTVHGIDGVLDPSFATKCSVPYIEPAADAVSSQVNRVFLDRAMRGLWRKGYNVVAAAMSIRRSELLSLSSVTVFAVSDENLFMKPGGYHYDFRHHVVPMRLRFADFAKSAARGMELFTLAPNKTVVVESVDGAVNVDGVAMSMTEVYHNRWIVVVSVMSSLDDVTDSQRNPPLSGGAVPKSYAPSPSPYSIVSGKRDPPRVQSPAPAHTKHSRRKPRTTVSVKPAPSPSPHSQGGDSSRFPSPHSHGGDSSRFPSPHSHGGDSSRFPSPHSHGGDSSRFPSPAPSYIEENEFGGPSTSPASSDDFDSVESPSPAPELDGDMENAPSIGSPSSNPEIDVAENPASPPMDDVSVSNCHLNAVLANGVEGGDLLCPDKAVRELREVDESRPLYYHSRQVADDLSQFYKVKLAENVNIADDVFFYI